MFWISKMPMLAALPLALVGVSAAYADTIIVRSSGPSAKTYNPGKSLPASATLALQAGDAVTILDASGTRVLKGPGTFPISGASSTNAGSSFSQFLRNTGTRQARTGATRGGLNPARSPNVWFVDVSKAGNMCVADAKLVTLWRPNANAAQSLMVTRMSDNKSATVQFAMGQTTRGWPMDDMPIADRAQYRLTTAGQTSPATIAVHVLDASSPNLEDTASALIKQGCAAQIDLLIDTVAVDAQRSDSARRQTP